MTPKALKEAYDAAALKLGIDLPLALARAFGGVHGIEDVPAEKHSNLTQALTRILNGGQITMAQARIVAHGDRVIPAKPARQTGEEVFAGIRADAYGDGDGDDDKPAPRLDPVAIMKRWNATKRPTED